MKNIPKSDGVYVERLLFTADTGASKPLVSKRLYEKVQVGKDQEKAQSEKDSHSKNRGGKKTNKQSGTYTMKHIESRISSYFPNRWPLSYLNLWVYMFNPYLEE